MRFHTYTKYSPELADAVETELDKQVFATRHTERISTALGGRQSGIVLVDDMDQGVDVVNMSYYVLFEILLTYRLC